MPIGEKGELPAEGARRQWRFFLKELGVWLKNSAASNTSNRCKVGTAKGPIGGE